MNCLSKVVDCGLRTIGGAFFGLVFGDVGGILVPYYTVCGANPPPMDNVVRFCRLITSQMRLRIAKDLSTLYNAMTIDIRLVFR